MAKKKRKDKEVAKLRSEVEVLRAQLKVSGVSAVSMASMEEKEKPTTRPHTEDAPVAVAVDVRPDLRKTAILTAVCLGILFLLYLTQSHWLP